LRFDIDDYVGNFNFKGKSVLDVGAASGFLTFEMEKRGATVVSFDVASAKFMQMDPRCDTKLMAHQESDLDRLKNAYWFCHRHFGSSAKVYYGDVHNLPPGLGPFDVVMAGMCLPHMRDPLGALESVSAKSSDAVIITQQTLMEDRPVMEMTLNPTAPEDLRYAWWMMSDGCLTKFMNVLGFRLEKQHRKGYACLAFTEPIYDYCTTFVFRRNRAIRTP